MSVSANVVNGELVSNGVAAQAASTNINKAIKAADKESGGALNKDAFLKLLVTQMQYQDPLEPTDNTEYVSQLATFSTLEEMQNMTSSMDRQRASGLVGQYVFLETKDSATGDTKTVEGSVDYVSFSGNKTYLSVNGTLYDIDDLQSVADADYMLAVKLSDTFSTELEKLTAVNRLTDDDLDSVGAIVEAYSNMTTYQKSFLTVDEMSKYGEYAEWYAMRIKALATENTENTDKDSEEKADNNIETDKTE